MVDVESLVLETAEQPPCGPDLEYAPAFRELELASLGKPEQQFGSTLIAAEGPAWEEVRDSALALLKRSKDLRVATLLVRALVRTEDFPGLLPGLQLILQLLQRYWDDVYPRFDADDDNDPTMRINALAPLVDADGLIRDVRDSRLVRSRQHGQLVVRDIEVALGKLAPRKNSEVMNQQQIDGILSAIAAEDVAPLVQIGQTLAAAKELSGFLTDKLGAERAPDFKPLLSILSLLAQLVQGVVAAAKPLPTGTAVLADDAVPADAVEVSMNSEIRTRAEALLVIDKLVDYFERNEPSSPAPLLIKRARRLISMSFIDIIKEIAPDGLKQIETLAGSGRER